MNYINIHTHTPTSKSNVREIVSLYDRFDTIPGGGLYSAGLHPRHIHKETAEAEWNRLQRAVEKDNVLAVGECGLDRICETDWRLQEEYFIRQIDLAAEMKKPLIIHCVRAFDETVLLLKTMNVRVPVIFHGFNKGFPLAEKLLREGYSLSFGKHLLSNETVREVFRRTPGEKLFLETDAAEMDIQEVYRAAAEAKGMDLQKLAKQIEENMIGLFGEKMICDDE